MHFHSLAYVFGILLANPSLCDGCLFRLQFSHLLFIGAARGFFPVQRIAKKDKCAVTE